MDHTCEHLLEYVRVGMVAEISAHEHIAIGIKYLLSTGNLKNYKQGIVTESAA